MTDLSKRAVDFLAKAKWVETIKDEKEIIKAFTKVQIEPRKEVVDFQLKFGGLMVKAGLEPIVYGILHTKNARGCFKGYEGKLCFSEPDFEIKEYHFDCADTLYQVYFSIDKYGRYFEDWELKCNNFNTWVEDFAMLKQVNKDKWKLCWQLYLNDQNKDIWESGYEELKRSFKLERLKDFPEDIISWETNGQLILWKQADSISLLSKKKMDAEMKRNIEMIFAG